MIARTDTFVAHVAAHAGVAGEVAERAARATLSGLGAHLSPAHRELLAEQLTPALAALVLAPAGLAVPLDERVMEACAVSLGHAHELVASVCHVLAEQVADDVLAAVRSSVPSDVARFLEPPAPALERGVVAPRRYDQLAAARPGSHHPLGESRPPERAHHGSIAAANPHDDTKLSSAAGLTQERLGDTLADGRTRPEQPLSGSRR